jgi:uncharacterized delta-60 repeat protein
MWFSSWLLNRTVSRKQSPVNRSRPRLEVLEDRCVPSAGQLDPTFGTGGKVITDIQGPTVAQADAVVVPQPDGKVIAVASSQNINNNGQIALLRYNTDGSLDNSFGSKGQVAFTLTSDPSSNVARAVAVDTAGRILVAGETYDSSTGLNLVVARLNPDGSLDAGFGSGGKEMIGFGTDSNFAGGSMGVAVDSSGRVVVAGTIFNRSTSAITTAVGRLKADGTLDSSFGSGGDTTISINSPLFGSGYTEGVAVDSSGRVDIVADGYLFNPSSHFVVTRLTADGMLDSNFGSGGETTITFGTHDRAAGVAIDSSGRIVVAGTTYNFSSTSTGPDFAVARLKDDGTLDSNFGSSGETTVSFGTGFTYDEAASLALDASGRVIVAGTTLGNVTSGRPEFAVARLSASGTLDGSFGNSGTTTISFGTGPFTSDYAKSVAVDASGRVIVLGSTTSDVFGNVGGGVLEVARLTSAGSLDAGWGTSGRVTTAVLGPSVDQAANLVLTQPDGKIVVVGTSFAQADTELSVARYNADGSLDSSFNGNGIARFGSGSGQFLTPTSVTVDASGRLLVAGYLPYFFGSYADFAVLRLNADGSPDTSFGTAGRATVRSATGSTYDKVQGVTVDSSGRVVLAGTSSSFITGSQFAVARLNADGSKDTGFGSGGETTIRYGIGYTQDTASGLALDAAGRIVVAGTTNNFSTGTGFDFAVTRLNSNGSLDTSFGSSGKTTIDFGSAGAFSSDSAAGVALDASGRIVVAGSTFINSSQDFAVARLNSDGSLDPTWGAGGKTTLHVGPSYSTDVARGVAIDPAGRIAVAGSTGFGGTSSFALALFKPNGCPDVDFGTGGQVTTDLGSFNFAEAAGLAFDSAGRLVVAGTTASDNITANDFAVVRYLAHDPVVETSSATFAADLQAAVTALDTSTPLGTPRVVVHVSDPAQIAKFAPALAALSVNPAGAEIEILLDVDAGSYNLGQVTVPAGLRLIIDGAGGACSGTFTASVAGDVVIRDGAVFAGTGSAPALVVRGGQVSVQGSTFTASGNASTILVQGGQFTLRTSTVQESTGGSQAAIAITGGQVDLGTSADPSDPNYGGNTINVNGTGSLIRLTGPNNVLAFGDTFLTSGQSFVDNFRIEDAIDHGMDGLGSGVVFWVPNNVYVSATNGNMQLGVNYVLAGGTVNVEAGGRYAAFAVGSKLLTVQFADGSSIVQQADSLSPTQRSLLVSDPAGGHSIKFVTTVNPGEVQVALGSQPKGTFLPTGRLIAHAGYSDDVQVDSGISLSAWLYADGGNDRLKGGSGNNVLIGDSSGDLLVGGSGRSLLIGYGADKLLSNGGQDILIAGSTSYDFDEVALAAIMAEWTSSDSLAARVANLTDNTASPYFSAPRNNGNYFLLDSGPNQTVFNDFSADKVTAGSGPDWIFASSTDKVNGLTAADLEFIFGF